mmetsp:Transcript_4982/g.9489  ORF Transcript_4982/g.9489 Transcript_4982/m.9489 type:complete len:269 (+) Transcript_4982:76-882(+)
MDDEWKEYRVHETTHHNEQEAQQQKQKQQQQQDDNHDDDDDDDDVLDRDIVFKMFQTKDDDDIVTEEYKFPQFDHVIALRGTSEITNSTGLALWRGAEVLASFLANHPNMIRDKCILELGAGQGLCGLVAHHLGACKVVITDGDTNVLNNLRENANLNTTHETCNNQKVACPQLIWGRDLTDFLNIHNGGDKFQVLLATDVNYMASSLHPFWKTASEALEPDHGILLYANVSASQCSMDTILSFAKEYGFEWETPTLEVYIFRLTATQ